EQPAALVAHGRPFSALNFRQERLSPGWREEDEREQESNGGTTHETPRHKCSPGRSRSAGLDRVDLNAGRVVVDIVPAEQIGQSLMKIAAGRKWRRAAVALRYRQGRGGRHCRTATAGLILDLGVGVEVRATIEDLHGGEAGLLQAAPVVVARDGPRDAADVGRDAGGEVIRQRLL